MKKRYLFIPLMLLSLILISLIFLFILYSNENNIPITGKVIADYSENSSANLTDNSFPIDNFALSDKLHWTHMPLTYGYNEVFYDGCENCSLVCSTSNKEKIQKAFDQIAKETDNLVSFEEINKNEDKDENITENPDIEIYCYGDKSVGEGEFLTLGEGQYTSEGNKIISAKINFYGQNSGGKNSNCLELMLHETFHILGFKHTEEGLMKPELTSKVSGNYRCQYNIDEYIINDLKEIYR